MAVYPNEVNHISGTFKATATPGQSLGSPPSLHASLTSLDLLDLHGPILYLTRRVNLSPAPTAAPRFNLGPQILVRATADPESSPTAVYRDIVLQKPYLTDVATRHLGTSNGRPLVEIRGILHGAVLPDLVAGAAPLPRPPPAQGPLPDQFPTTYLPAAGCAVPGCELPTGLLVGGLALWVLFSPIWAFAFLVPGFASWSLPGLCKGLAVRLPLPRLCWPCIRWPRLAHPWPLGCGGLVLSVPLLGLVMLAPSCNARACAPVGFPILALLSAAVLLAGLARRSWVTLAAVVVWFLVLASAAFRNDGCSNPAATFVLERLEEFRSRDRNAELMSQALAAANAPRQVGIDDAVGQAAPCGQTIYLSGDLLFRFNDYRLRESATPILRKVERVLLRSPKAEVVLGGHADSAGDPVHNQVLSQRRAEQVAHWLLRRRAISEGQIVVVGHGETRPLVDESIAPAELNRRVEVTIKCPAAESAP